MDTDVAPLVVTADDRLLDDALRWCAAAGATPEVAHDVAAARRAWRAAPVVLVGEDLATRAAAAGLPRRDLVVLVVDDPERWWPVAVGLGATEVVRRADDARVLDLVSSALDGRGEACLVSVVGGSGGVGASTFATTLGLAGARRALRSLLIDLDVTGGGIDLVLGAERVEGLRWPDLDVAHGRLAAGSLAQVLPSVRDLSMLTWRPGVPATLPEAVAPVLTAAGRAFDLVVADVPRHLDGTGLEVVERSVLSVLVVAEELRALSASRQVLDRLAAAAPSVAVVSVPRRGGLGVAAVEEALGLPVLARLRPVRAMRGAVDRGYGPPRAGRVRRPVGAVLDALGLEAA